MSRLIAVRQELDRCSIPHEGAKFVEWVRELYLAVPEEHRKTATFDLINDGVDDRAQLEFEWWRPETQEEADQRVKAITEATAVAREQRRQNLRKWANEEGFDLVERQKPA